MNEGFVYLLVDSNENYKIGITTGDIHKRIKSLQTGSSGELVLINKHKSKHYRKIETNLHRKYNHLSTDGGKEWFSLPPEIVLNFKNECQKLDEIFDTLIKAKNPFII
jgi:hypothetical protein